MHGSAGPRAPAVAASRAVGTVSAAADIHGSAGAADSRGYGFAGQRARCLQRQTSTGQREPRTPTAAATRAAGTVPAAPDIHGAAGAADSGGYGFAHCACRRRHPRLSGSRGLPRSRLRGAAGTVPAAPDITGPAGAAGSCGSVRSSPASAVADTRRSQPQPPAPAVATPREFGTECADADIRRQQTLAIAVPRRNRRGSARQTGRERRTPAVVISPEIRATSAVADIRQGSPELWNPAVPQGAGAADGKHPYVQPH